jgi:glycosyltransferase involved in cell wall biosynthesis
MRVGLIHWAIPPTTGGVESHVVDLATALAALGCQVTVLTGELTPDALQNVDIHPISLLNLGMLREAKVSLRELVSRLTAMLESVINERRLQVIHGHNLHHFVAAPALALDALWHAGQFSLHHTFHETWPDVLSSSPVYRHWNGNYAVSQFVQKQCVCHLKFEPQLRPLGIDVTRFHTQRPCMSNSESFVILHPARLLPWKGVHVSVDMLARLRSRAIPARLIITDTQRIVDWNDELDSYRKRIIKKIRSHKLQDVIEFRSVPYCDIVQLYEEVDVVVYPTVGEEPYGLVPLEAMSMRRPIIASRSGGLPETIVDGVTGFLIERGDSAALAECVERLFSDRQFAQQLGEAGRRHVVSKFNGHDYAAQLLEQYAASI